MHLYSVVTPRHYFDNVFVDMFVCMYLLCVCVACIFTELIYSSSELNCLTVGDKVCVCGGEGASIRLMASTIDLPGTMQVASNIIL